MSELPAPGWYADSEDEGLQRLWTGVRWIGLRRVDPGPIFGFEYAALEHRAPGGSATPARPGRAARRGTRDVGTTQKRSPRFRLCPPPLGLVLTQRGAPWTAAAGLAVVVVATLSLTIRAAPSRSLAHRAPRRATPTAPTWAPQPPQPDANQGGSGSSPSPKAAIPAPAVPVPGTEPAPAAAGIATRGPHVAATGPAASAIEETAPAPPALPAPSPPPSPSVLTHAHGSGISQTNTFTTRGAWSVYWSYDCSARESGTFDFTGYTGAGQTADIYGPAQSGTSATGVEHYSPAGTFDLVVNSYCTWDIQVVG